MKKTPPSEIKSRMQRFKESMSRNHPEWDTAVVFSNVNLFYFTGTMQDGVFIIPRDEKATFWVKRSYERALDESLFPDIRSMNSFRDAAHSINKLPDTVYLETEVVPLALYGRFHKHFPFKNYKSLNSDIAAVRAVKSEYELSLMRKSGRIHQHVLEDLVPDMLQEGISEADLSAQLFSVLIQEGHHGLTRFGMFDTEIVVGHVGFGESSLYPTYFDGASGNRGLSPAAQCWAAGIGSS
jgi:Xaa-Pro dipeptidase